MKTSPFVCFDVPTLHSFIWFYRFVSCSLTSRNSTKLQLFLCFKTFVRMGKSEERKIKYPLTLSTRKPISVLRFEVSSVQFTGRSTCEGFTIRLFDRLFRLLLGPVFRTVSFYQGDPLFPFGISERQIKSLSSIRGRDWSCCYDLCCVITVSLSRCCVRNA